MSRTTLTGWWCLLFTILIAQAAQCLAGFCAVTRLVNSRDCFVQRLAPGLRFRFSNVLVTRHSDHRLQHGVTYIP